ncbi:MAG: YitT family protein [Bacteroidales bacterium]|nr:YitT family protein [Bacteroidales bacterium]
MKQKPLKILEDYLLLTLGVILYTAAWGIFIIPNGLSAGGLTGLCVIIQMATGNLIPVSASYAVLNAALLIIAFFIMGRGFGIRTIYCIFLSSILLELWAMFPSIHAVEGHFLYVPERFLLPVIGGALEAFAINFIFSRGGSTGGTDILAIIINKYWPVSLGKVFMICDCVIITSILFIPGKVFSDMVYGYIMMITFSVMLDFLFLGRQSSVKILVFSEKYPAIADHIINELDRGVTVLNAQGWYTKKDKNVLLIIVRKRQLRELQTEIKAIDPHAFMTVSPTSGVYGEGFEEIKTGIKNKTSNGNVNNKE